MQTGLLKMICLGVVLSLFAACQPVIAPSPMVNPPISPAVYVTLLGKGMDVDWARFSLVMEGYDSQGFRISNFRDCLTYESASKMILRRSY